mgnify:FL=1
MRIAVVAPCPFPALRGSQVLIRQLAEALAERGHEVHVACYAESNGTPEVPGVHIHRAGWALRSFKAWLPWIVWKGLNDVALAWQLRRLLRQKPPDVIHAHNYEGPLVAWLAQWRQRTPVIYHAHNVLSDELPSYARTAWGKGLRGVFGAWLDRQIPRRAQLGVALSMAQAAYLRMCGVGESCLRVCPPPRPRAAIGRGEGRMGLQHASHWVVGYAGNFDAYQDLAVLAQAIDLLREEGREPTLLLVTHERRGKRELPLEMRRLVAAGAARIVWAAGIAEAMEVMGRAHVLVCPRSSWSGFPIKLVNYAALGSPILLSESVARSIRWPEPASVFPDRNPVALAALLRQLERDPALRRKLRDASRRFWWSLPDRSQVGEWLERAMVAVASGEAAPSYTCDEWQSTAGENSGVDSQQASSYKPPDGSREGDARA